MRQVGMLLGCLLLSVTPAWAADVPALEVSAKSAIVIDEVTGTVLFEKAADVPRYPASTTKILTALLMIEHTRPTDIIVAPKDVETVKESSLHIKPGEKFTAHDLMMGIMLRSANDGCYTAACHISGSVAGFSALMNARAKAIGCTNTRFTNPNGLHDPLHKTTARDLALISREAMSYPEFREVAKTWKYRITRSINQGDRTIISRNKWLRKDKTADGIKTGYTSQAGHCYVGSATRNGFRVITVILNSGNWQKDHEAMLNHAFRHYERRLVARKNEPLGTLNVAGGKSSMLPVAISAPLVAMARRKGELPKLELPREAIDAPVEAGQTVGKGQITDIDGRTREVPLIALEAVDVPPLAAARSSHSIPYVLLGGFGVGAYWWVRKSRPRKYGKRISRSRSL